MKMNKTIALVAAAVCLGVAVVLFADRGEEDKPPIKLALNEWTGQNLTTYVAGALLEKAGFTVEYVTAGYGPQCIAMGEGTIHASLEIWTSNEPGQCAEAREKGVIKDIGSLELAAREGVLYPVHMKELCPGLPDWQALNDCADKFATVDTRPNGRLLDYPADWGSPGKDRFEALGINYTAVPAGSEGALTTELDAAVQKKSPLLMTFWQPHWALAAYETEWVALPAGTPECYEDASWGSNKSATGDCDFLPTRIFKITWSGFDKEYPLAAEILKAYTMDAGDQQRLMAAVDGRKEDIKEVVAAYVQEKDSDFARIIADAKS